MSVQESTAGVGAGFDVSKLNEQQARAVGHSGSPLAVLAGPGTGKTRVIVSRIARLVSEGVDPTSIVGLTFGTKAAREMQERLVAMLGPRDGSRVRLSTFHSWGRRFVSRYGDEVGFRGTPRLMDSAQLKRLLGELIVESGAFREMRSMGVDRAVDAVSAFIEGSVHAGREARDALAFASGLEGRDLGGLDENGRVAAEVEALRFRDCARVYELYEKASAERGLVAMFDLVMAPVRILRSNDLISRITRAETRHVVVDEFQDVNLGQIELLKALCPPGEARDLCVVGDDDQAIYAFRGSDERAFGRFASIWTDHEVIPLTINYRSTKTIVEASSAFIGMSETRFEPDKVLESNPARADDGEPIRFVTCPKGRKEEFGVVIASMIGEAMAADDTLRFKHFAVIGPTHGSLSHVERELEVAEVPVLLGRAPSAMDDPAVRDLFAWMRVVADGSGASDVYRVIRRPLFGVSAEEVVEWGKAWRRERNETGEAFVEWLGRAKGEDERVRLFIEIVRELREVSLEQPATQCAVRIVHRCHIAEGEALSGRERAKRVRRVARALSFVSEREKGLPAGDVSLASFLEHYDLLDDRDRDYGGDPEDRVDGGEDESGEVDAVRLLTAHASKGLEFRHVFIVNVRPGSGGMPNSMKRDEPLVPLPSAYTGADEPDTASEQRRLCYVAMTRAEERLTLFAEEKKGKTGPDFFIDLTETLDGISRVMLETSDVIDRGDGVGAGDEVDQASSGGTTDRASRRARRMRALRDELMLVSFLAEQEGADDAALVARAGEIVRRLADVSREPVSADDGAPVFGPLRAPLELSYTKLEDYNRCPRCFYAKHVLKLPDISTSGARVGTIAHEALEKFFREVRDADTGEGLFGSPGEERLLEIARGLYDMSVLRERGGGVNGAGVPDELEWEKISEQLRTALRDMHDPDANIVEIECEIKGVPIEVLGEMHTFTSKIDRIDQYETGGGVGYRIIDYKTGRRTKKLAEPEANDLQFGLYLMALRHFFGMEETPEGVAEYWILESGEKGALSFDEINMKRVMTIVNKAVKGMLEGRWTKGDDRGCRGLCEVIPW